jgi:hypothetical protein
MAISRNAALLVAVVIVAFVAARPCRVARPAEHVLGPTPLLREPALGLGPIPIGVAIKAARLGLLLPR